CTLNPKIRNNFIRSRRRRRGERAYPAAIGTNPNAFEQAALNLIQNAVDAMVDVKMKRLSIATYREKGRAVLRISDTGKGIPLEHEDKIFEPFFSTKAPGKGVGLGLTLAEHFLRSCEAHLELGNAVDDGASFLISFPLSEG
ncbi:ATP-binding protein, partial [Bdellovibrionota bacterium FG-2]